MNRALLTLVAGVVAAVVLAVLVAPGAVGSSGFALVLLTILAGALVMGVTARRATLRDRAAALAEEDSFDAEAARARARQLLADESADHNDLTDHTDAATGAAETEDHRG